ncbi:MAG: serine--tRNA ligase [Candidatus Niyogibacteria bacterium RIFCSPLOWO2_01_FULL_45_48]|uniref:Serine--tRNA ligase n=2 Tax=Candidatus Niyogiibacteriota TaxID=1817912 RepID=A0A1G2EXM6_9BACT|nr:MAG: serine--tRNA ligase [Candidatus Niyogibacteria bacterium RIFCSPHIGHO2_01_FULL_45_28]OGZ30101.1 MAG: serine--tRNA ligase [Candidatus Niyogibacteria bacterium RIFCSPLOWO2_02_FULL_45_13]OGZ31132.1 MAG: serine--tRNA ligase [Candidatus Niyogibacteria bacterium RIFCSPLOWO2_01_FULL_45_48]
MLDVKFIRENPDLVKQAVRKKRLEFGVDEFLVLDENKRKLMAEVEELRAKQNRASDRISAIADENEKNAAVKELRELKDVLSGKEYEFKKIDTEWRRLMLDVPNIPDPSVPDGADERDAREERKWGEPRKFDFEPVGHITLMERLDLLELERGTKVSGFRGYFLKNEAALLSQAIWLFVLAKLKEKGYTPVLAPVLVKEENLFGSGHFPQSREDVYKTQDDLYLSATAEIPMMGMHSDEVIPESELPKKYAAFSPCFRREAGSYGKDTKGIYRLHEFYKVEQLILSRSDHQDSVRLHEEITTNAEEVVQALGLPYRIITLAGGDIGRAHVKTYDIEVWIPSERRYRESHSSSYYHDFQTRRLNIRYKSKEEETRFCYSLNNTAIATPRILISILENNQRSDGSVEIPEVLRKYTGFDLIGPKT